MNEQPGFFNALSNAWRDIFLALSIAVFSGIIAHIYRMRNQSHPVFILTAFIADVGISGFVGFVAFMYCMHQNMSPWLTGPVVGIASHFAPRLIFLGDKWIVDWLQKKLGMSGRE